MYTLIVWIFIIKGLVYPFSMSYPERGYIAKTFKVQFEALQLIILGEQARQM